MLNLYDEMNERLELKVTSDLVREYRPELFTFLRHLNLAHLVEEVWEPMCISSRTLAALAIDARPWPPKGVGAKRLRGFAMALIVDDRQALFTPALLSPEHPTNVGLAAGLTKVLFEKLIEERIERIAVLVNNRSHVVAGELRSVGFEPGEARVLSDGAEFVSFAADPDAILKRLGLKGRRLGDILSLAVDQAEALQLTALHLTLAAGISGYWGGHAAWAEVFPGLIDWAALPPGGIGGTPGPAGEIINVSPPVGS
ncbi:hypothetical protein [Azotobacter chroococcum]|uniref:Uncharacterized protein n=1 Tax=Azotobacter chroococcum TaxID=353 RepID=A0AAP9YF29_9GAMM|nr:hypothetical protein [Azotobacter chroococcum]QQE89511.1 hypothetical protein GKQ51_03930 [Azotobacter chroococcum]